MRGGLWIAGLIAVLGCRETLDASSGTAGEQPGEEAPGTTLPPNSSLSADELDALLQEAQDADVSEAVTSPENIPGVDRDASASEAVPFGTLAPTLGASGQPWTPQDRFGFDPAGFPATEATTNPGCEDGLGLEEIPCNLFDDDCDGTVDEAPPLGSPCGGSECMTPGVFVCDTITQAITCVDAELRECVPSQNVLGCGDGVWSQATEECEYATMYGGDGGWCRRDCRHTQYPRCDAAQEEVVAHVVQAISKCEERFDEQACEPLWELKRDVQAMRECARDSLCVENVGACLPVISEENPRCPDVPREPPYGCGNHYIEENEECEPPAVNALDGTVCSWECKWVPDVGNPAEAPPLPMLEVSLSELGPVVCVVQCASDRDCPSATPDCYMGTCVAPLGATP